MFGYGELLRESLARLGRAILWRGTKRILHPTLGELSRVAKSSFVDAGALLAGELDAPSDAIEQWRREFDDLLVEKQAGSAAGYPAEFRLGRESAFCIYALTRWLRPEAVFESGVADGFSSSLLLAALKENGTGRLISTDISDDVGELVVENRDLWELRILRSDRMQEDFIEALTTGDGIGLFIHDSDHRYHWQRWELEIARRELGREAFIACDDVDYSHAFINFCAEKQEAPTLLIEPGKVFGILLGEASRKHTFAGSATMAPTSRDFA